MVAPMAVPKLRTDAGFIIKSEKKGLASERAVVNISDEAASQLCHALVVVFPVTVVNPRQRPLLGEEAGTKRRNTVCDNGSTS